jgi:FMN reductase
VLAHSLRGWPTPLGIALNMAGPGVFAEDGSVLEPSVGDSVRIMADQLMSFGRIPAVAPS